MPECDPLRVERVSEVLHVIMEFLFLVFFMEASIAERKEGRILLIL